MGVEKRYDRLPVHTSGEREIDQFERLGVEGLVVDDVAPQGRKRVVQRVGPRGEDDVDGGKGEIGGLRDLFVGHVELQLLLRRDALDPVAVLDEDHRVLLGEVRFETIPLWVPDADLDVESSTRWSVASDGEDHAAGGFDVGPDVAFDRVGFDLVLFTLKPERHQQWVLSVADERSRETLSAFKEFPE